MAYGLKTYANNQKPDWTKKCESVFFSKFKGNSNTRFGNKYEKVALDICESDFGVNSIVWNVGFIVHVKYPWLGCSPDGFLIEGNQVTLLECKCLQKGKFLEGMQFLRQCFFLQEGIDGDGQFSLKRLQYYSQIQLSLFICNLEHAKLVLYNHKRKRNFYICVDQNINYRNALVDRLTRTYFNKCLLYLWKNEHRLLTT